jgi:hypothetical protein
MDIICKTPTKQDLIVFCDEDGMPWLAFVWGHANPVAVADLITLEEVENQTGCDEETVIGYCSWPPRVQSYWLRTADGDDDMYLICDADHPGAQQVTGHRFYPQI